MGCSGSKPEDSPLVIRCRERRELVRAAADHRYALAAAHASYFRSLKHVGYSLGKFAVDGEDDEDVIPGDEESHLHLSDSSSSDNDAISESDYKLRPRSHGGNVRKGKDFDGGAINSHNREKSSPDNRPANVYNVEKSAPAMETVVQDAPGSYWNYPPDYGGHSPNYSPARTKNSEGFTVSPQKEASDFFNPFAVFGNGQTGYDPIGKYGYGSDSTSPDLSEVREREGIPDLEEETENDHQVFKFKEMSSGETNPGSRTEPVLNSNESEKQLVPLQNSKESRNLRDVVAEIRDDFVLASGYGDEVASMLEIEKLPYRPGFLKASASIKLSIFYFEDFVKDVNATACNLSSTLEKLFAWEKKLCKEVKDEERLRVKYEKWSKRLKILDKEGAEPGKIHTAQTSMRRLRIKLNVSIKAIGVISSRIHELRDEELHPHVAALIHGLIRMWKAMLECHQRQFQAIMEIKTRKLRPKTGHKTTTAELENELLSWCHRFKDWIGFQKSYVESLNGWLLKCLQYETEGTLDKQHNPAYSPCQLGAPPIFIICNDWQKALESISEDRVSAVDAFSTCKSKQDAKLDEIGLVDDVIDSCSIIGGGLVPIFKALESITREAVRAHELVRL